MSDQLTQEQFDALAKLIRAKTSSASYSAAKLVIVESMSIGKAAKQAGVTYNAAYQAVTRFNGALELVKIIAKNN